MQKGKTMIERLVDDGGLTVAFDVDGTLVDTAPDLMLTLNHILKPLGLPEIESESVRQMIGLGARVLIDKSLDLHQVTRTEAEVDVLFDQFIEHYSQNIAAHSRLFPGMAEILERYDKAGVKLAACTNKLEYLTVSLFAELDITKYFGSIIGRDTVGIGKPDPAPLYAAIDQAGGKRDRAVFIGDSITDVNTSKAAGIPSIIVSFGYTPIPAHELGGDVLIDHFDELDTAISKLFDRK